MSSPDPSPQPGQSAVATKADAQGPSAPFADSYWLSSLELRHGVEVEIVGVRTIAGEVLREFLRMHHAWRKVDRRAAFGVASPRISMASSLVRMTALDIAFEADGSVTIPGELLSSDE